MRCSILLPCAALVWAVYSAIPGFTISGGKTRLLGSSFGIPGVNATFDYVIIGGGTSGLTIARRLAANPAVSVAVIEAGGFYEIDNGNVSQIPNDAPQYSSPSPTSPIQPLVDWGIITKPQTVRINGSDVFNDLTLTALPQQLNDREIHYTQGKCLGGSSARNYLAYHRSSSGAYQRWANQVGDQSYSFDAIFPYFQKSAHFTPPDYAKRGTDSEVSYDSTAFDTNGGPLQVSYTNYHQPIAAFVKRAYLSLGLPNIAGFNSGNLLGFSEFTLTVDPQAATRSSSETSYLQEAISSTTLRVYQQTVAKKILIDEDKIATGVSVVTAGTEYTLNASREVILAAGALHSPQMLMISGIGPSTVLKQFQIPVIVDAAGVGQGMWDQPLYSISYKVNVTTNSQLLVNPEFAQQATEDYLQSQTGPLGGGGASWVGWEKLPPSLRKNLSNSTLADLAQFPSDWPELELVPQASTSVTVFDTDNYASVGIALSTTTSRGNVTITSADSKDNPLVSPNLLLTKTDQELAIQGFKRARQVAMATGITLGPEISPGPDTQTDAQILEFIKQSVGPYYHAAATCAMGRANGSMAVVDTEGRVFGVQSLRVVDSSIFAFLPPGHPQATVYMLAEKLADAISRGNLNVGNIEE